MKAWGIADTLTVACLLLVIPYSTKCDKGEGLSPKKIDSRDPKTGVANAVGHVENVTSNFGHLNASSVSLAPINSTVNTSKSPELHLSSREGVPTKGHSTQSLPEVVSTSGKPSIQPPITKEPPKVLSSADATKNQNKTGESSDKKGVLNWMEGGGSPVLKPKESESSEHPKSSPQVPGEDIASTSMEPHKNIAARKGAGVPPGAPNEPHPPHVEHADHAHPHSGPSTVSTAPPTTHPRKHKPHFTMVQGDKFSSGSESIIESATTGRDYIFPLVLLIFAFPGTVFLIRFLYKRGTEFTERQQYHRMYLIDDDFRTPFFERWKRAIIRYISGENCQAVNLTNVGEMGVNPRTNYNSF